MYQDKSMRRGSSGQTPPQDEWIEAAVVGTETLAGPFDPDGVQYD